MGLVGRPGLDVGARHPTPVGDYTDAAQVRAQTNNQKILCFGQKAAYLFMKA